MDSFNNNDSFKQFVKSKLADYKHNVPPSGWEKLESSLFATQKTKVIYTKWIISSVATVAAALIGAFFLFQNMSNELATQTAENKTEQQATPTHKKEKSLITEENSSNAEKSASPLLTDNTTLFQQKHSTSGRTIIEEQASLNVSDHTSHEKEVVDSSKNEPTKKSNKFSDLDEKQKQQLIQDFINEGKRSYSKTEDTEKRKKKGKFAVSLTGQSSLSSSQQTNTVPTTLRSSVSESYGMYTMSKMQAHNEDTDVNPKSEKIHRQPISFGILTSFNITDKLQVETGLIYTFLSSETKNNSVDFHNSEKTQFHYLGLPVNLNYTVLSINKLDLFLTGGAMIEKDVYGVIKYNDKKEAASLNSGYDIGSSSKINQRNPQLSVNGGVGITYPIYNKTKLFGKIGGRYYINANNEYKTYYSDEDFGLDIQLGLKFNF